MARKLEIRVLDETIKNPCADGRKRGWHGAKTFTPGRYIFRIGANELLNRVTHISKIGHSHYDSIGIYREAEAVDALVAATKPVQPEGILEIVAIATGNDDASGSRDILGVLLKQGIVTADQITAAQDALDENEDLYDEI